MYSDRLLLYEECLGDLTECVLGGALMRAMSAQLSPILQLSEAYARLRAERDQRILRSIWQRIEPKTGGSIGFLSYLHFLASNHYRDISPTADTLDEFLEELHSLVQRHSDGRRACLRSSDLPRPALQSDDSRCLYSSIDLLIAAPNVEALQAGQFQLVLGECHPQPLLWVFPTAYFLEEPSTLATPINEYLGTQSGSSVSAQIAFSRKSKIFPYVLPGYVIELRPHYPDCQAIPAAEVQIRDVDGRLSLWAGATRLQLYSPLTRRDTGADPLAPFALPGVEPPLVDMGDHTPRIEIDNIVYQRERWVVTSESLADIRLKDFDRFLDLWRWKSRLNLPDEIFVRIQGEPKPIYIDLTNYFLADLLDRLARKTSKLVITEMVPNTEELWLDGREGQHSSELRIMAFRPSTE